MPPWYGPSRTLYQKLDLDEKIMQYKNIYEEFGNIFAELTQDTPEKINRAKFFFLYCSNHLPSQGSIDLVRLHRLRQKVRCKMYWLKVGLSDVSYPMELLYSLP